jgi:hypothetical protein
LVANQSIDRTPRLQQALWQQAGGKKRRGINLQLLRRLQAFVSLRREPSVRLASSVELA